MKSSAYPPPEKPSYEGYLPLIFTSRSSATSPPLFFKNLNAPINEGVYTRRTMVSSRRKISIDLHLNQSTGSYMTTTMTFFVLSSIYTKEFNIILEILIHSILKTEL